jgi:cytochrome c551/c552
MKMTKPFQTACSILAMTMVLGANPAVADSDADMAVLATKNGCLACHSGVAERKGPPYKEVAAKYARQKNAEETLVNHIMKGTGPDGVGWMKAGKASLPSMPANSTVSKEDARKLARWVLSINKEIPDVSGKFVTERITVSGSVKNRLTLDVTALQAFPNEQVGEVPLVCQTGANVGKIESFRGVRLADILNKAEIDAPGHNDVKKMAIIATASDNYHAVFSWNEIFNSPVGEGVYVFFEKDGLPLDEKNGRIALVSTKDTNTGPRHVKWLQSIEVVKLVK